MNPTIVVTLLDEATGERLAVSNIPAADLPETFAVDTRLSIAQQQYTVVRAEPPTKVQFTSSGRLNLTLRKVETLDPNKILFSLPTICGEALPASAPDKPSGGVCVLHEDDFRQCEFVALAHAEAIAAEFAAIQDIFTNASAEAGFHKLHVRERIPNPLPPGITWKSVTSHLGRVDRLGGVAFGDGRQLVTGAVAGTLRNGLVLWGVEADRALRFLCIQNGGSASQTTIEALRNVANSLSLVIVDWCRCRVVCPGGSTIAGSLGDPWDAVD